MALDVSKRILLQFHTFSKSQKKLATLVLNDCGKVAYLTAERFGQIAGCSESTVVRFSKALGYFGYMEFQDAVQQLMKSKLTPNERIAISKKRIGRKDIIESVMQEDINKIRVTFENLDRKAFYDAVDAILEAKRIYIIGARSSESVAQLLSYNLSLILDNVRLVRPSSSAEVFEQMFSIGEGDVVIAFSFPRYSTKVVNAVKFASANSARVIVVTDSNMSPLVQHSDYALIAQSDMASFMDSLVAPISIVNTIIVEITGRREKEILARFDKLEELWGDYDVYDNPAKHR